jgi:hypothetical protein
LETSNGELEGISAEDVDIEAVWDGIALATGGRCWRLLGEATRGERLAWIGAVVEVGLLVVCVGAVVEVGEGACESLGIRVARPCCCCSKELKNGIY